MRKYKRNNKTKQNAYERSLYQNNINYKIGKLIRQRIVGLIRGFKKSYSLSLLGCSIDFLKEHLQQTAIQNGYLDFDINNYSGQEYHIDHIIPLLSAKENLIKGESFLL